jgi:sarcosine oxidase, subunit beta
VSTSTRPLPTRASVVIIGGGVIGTSTAFHLAEAGVREVVLIERGELGSGSTGRAAGGVRAQFSDELNIKIAQRSLRAFDEFHARPGSEIDLKRVGYLFLLTRDTDVAAFARNVELQRNLGVPSEMLTPAQARRLCPLLRVDDVVAAAFSPSDGHATPDGVVQGYASGARAHGARIVTRCAVQDIEVQGGEIRAVVTSRGRIETDVVICAAGPWSRECGAMSGVDLPVTPLRRDILFTEPISDLPARFPMTIDFATGFYFHREGPGILMGMPDPDERPGFDAQTSDEWIAALIEVADRRAPAISRAGIKGGWSGFYEMSPDRNALIGEVATTSRFLYATGFSGHGFLQGPAVGEILRDLFLGRTPFVDVAPLSVGRFATADEMRPEFNVI